MIFCTAGSAKLLAEAAINESSESVHVATVAVKGAAERYEPTCSAHGRRHCEECIAGAPPATERLSRNEVADALRQLKELHSEGILTDDEYEAKRRTLSDRL